MISCEENKNKRQNILHMYCFNWVHAEKNNTNKRKHMSLRCIVSLFVWKCEKLFKSILLILKIHCARYHSIILFWRKTPSYNIRCVCYIKIYFFITDLLLMFTSLTLHIQWLMICLLKLPGFGESLLLLHALIAFWFIF